MSDDGETKRILTTEMYIDSGGTVYPYFTVVNIVEKENVKMLNKGYSFPPMYDDSGNTIIYTEVCDFIELDNGLIIMAHVDEINVWKLTKAYEEDGTGYEKYVKV